MESVGALVNSGDPVAALCDSKAVWGECAGDPRLHHSVRSAQQRLCPLIELQTAAD